MAGLLSRAPANIADIKTPQEAIKVSEELFLAQKRTDAALVLNKALEKYQKKDRTREQLISKLKAVTTTFYQENTQKTFEHGNSLYPEQNDEAMAKFIEALEAEPGNILVYAAMIRSEVRANKCTEALKHADEALLINPYNELVILLKIKALDCLNNFTAAEAVLSEKTMLLPKKNPQIMVSQAFWRLQEQKAPQAEELLRQAGELDKNFPEISYYKMQMLRQKEQSALVEAQKYVAICKNLSQKVITRYAATPTLCVRLKEVEEYVEGEMQKMESTDVQ